MNAITVGVIGHVDHGKTTLVQAVTGIETDRLAEEKRRGVSIVLGFAPLRTPEGTIDFIDMPGHERFIRAMVSGATGIAAVLLVIAANEGEKPQTHEHLEIARLLGIRKGIVALTKADLVTAAEARARKAEIGRLLQAAGLGDAPVILTSAKDRGGLTDLKAALTSLLRDTPPQRDDGFAYFPIDRVFARPGFGPVVTGTLRRGHIETGDEVELMPSGRRARVRTLQVHGASLKSTEPGRRTATSLRGIDLADIRPGMALVTPGMLVTSRWLDVVLEAARDTAHSLASGDRLRLLIGTTDTSVRLRLLDRLLLEPGQSALAQLRADEDVAVPAREAFILRLDSPSRTVGGGRVLNPSSQRRRRMDQSVLQFLGEIASGQPTRVLLARLREAGPSGASVLDLARLVGIGPSRVHRHLIQIGARPETGDRVVGPDVWADLRMSVIKIVANHHRDRPMEPGVALHTLAKALPGTTDPGIAAALVRELATGGDLVQSDGAYRLRSFDPSRQGNDATQRVEALFRAAGLNPPDESEIVRRETSGREILKYLVNAGILVRTVDRVQKRAVLFHRDAIEGAQRRMGEQLGTASAFTAGEAGAVLGISRKFSIPLLEHLDFIRFTQRRGDKRVIIEAHEEAKA